MKSKGKFIARTVHYKYGYKIVIRNKFYELSAGKKVLFYGELKHRPTPLEVWDMTVGLNQEEKTTGKNERLFR